MSSVNPRTLPTKNDQRCVRPRRNPIITLHILEIVLSEYFLPEYTWDEVEECLGWCYDVKVDPTPLRRIGREWIKRASGMRVLLEALHVRSTPERFCCGAVGVPHAIAILLGQIVEESQRWRTEVHCQDLGLWLMDFLDFPICIWWLRLGKENLIGKTWRRVIEKELPTWCNV